MAQVFRRLTGSQDGCQGECFIKDRCWNINFLIPVGIGKFKTISGRGVTYLILDQRVNICGRLVLRTIYTAQILIVNKQLSVGNQFIKTRFYYSSINTLNMPASVTVRSVFMNTI